MRWERVLARLILEQTQALFARLRRALGAGELGRAKEDLAQGYRTAHRTGMGWAVLDLLNARTQGVGGVAHSAIAAEPLPVAAGHSARSANLSEATQTAIEKRLEQIGVSLEVSKPEILSRLQGQIAAAQDRLEAAREIPGTPARAAGYAVRWAVQQGVADLAESAVATRAWPQAIAPVALTYAEGEELELLKVWVRLATRTEQRDWHDALIGVTIPYSRKFVLVGPNGTFEIERPYDPALPLSERIGCGHGLRVILPEGTDRLSLDLSQEPIRFVPDEAPNPPAKPRPSSFVPTRGSIREALTFGPKMLFSGRIARALDAVARVHGGGLFPPVLIRSASKIVDEYGNRGVAAYITVENRPDSLVFLRSGGWQLLDVVHEIGHLFDHQVVGKPGEFTSELEEGPLAGVMAAIRQTPTVQKLLREQKSGWVVADGKRLARADRALLEYLLKPRELFARAYAQYIAVTSGDADMLAQVGRRRDGPGGELWYPYQWGDEEFEPVAQALDRVLRDLWLTE